MQFYDSGIPMGYKMRINDYLSTVRVEIRPADSTPQGGASAAAGTLAAKAPDFSIPDESDSSEPAAGKTASAAPGNAGVKAPGPAAPVKKQ
jgi:hypothetical protein